MDIANAIFLGAPLKMFDLGDHLRVPAPLGVFYHHGIVVENTDVIHFIKKQKGSLPIIDQTSWSVFSERFSKKVFEVQHSRPLPPMQVVVRAKALLKLHEAGMLPYKLSKFNCEHLANWCKIGISYSQQVEDNPELSATLEFVEDL